MPNDASPRSVQLKNALFEVTTGTRDSAELFLAVIQRPEEDYFFGLVDGAEVRWPSPAVLPSGSVIGSVAGAPKFDFGQPIERKEAPPPAEGHLFPGHLTHACGFLDMRLPIDSQVRTVLLTLPDEELSLVLEPAGTLFALVVETASFREITIESHTSFNGQGSSRAGTSKGKMHIWNTQGEDQGQELRFGSLQIEVIQTSDDAYRIYTTGNYALE